MPNEVVLKKLEQIKKLLSDLEPLLSVNFSDFEKDSTNIRAAERNFQLIVDLAIDINTQILIKKEEKIPDTYRQSFLDLGRVGILDEKISKTLSLSASLRNILVHEYDFEEDSKKFYDSAKSFIEPYRVYVVHIYKHATS